MKTLTHSDIVRVWDISQTYSDWEAVATENDHGLTFGVTYVDSFSDLSSEPFFSLFSASKNAFPTFAHFSARVIGYLASRAFLEYGVIRPIARDKAEDWYTHWTAHVTSDYNTRMGNLESIHFVELDCFNEMVVAESELRFWAWNAGFTA